MESGSEAGSVIAVTGSAGSGAHVRHDGLEKGLVLVFVFAAAERNEEERETG